MDENIYSFRKGPSEKFVLGSVSLIGIFDSGNVLGEGDCLFQGILPDALVILLAKVINLLPEGIHR